MAADQEVPHSVFECNICLEQANDPVVTFCGHLYCWKCLYRWMRNGHNACPVCKSGVTRDTVIPLYGRGGEPVDPRSGAPPVRGDVGGAPAARSAAGPAGSDEAAQSAEAMPARPGAQRSEPPQNDGAGAADGWAGGGAAAGFMTAGFGFFPSLFALQFHSIAPPARPRGAPPLSPEEEAQLLHSRLLFAVGAGVILFLLLL